MFFSSFLFLYEKPHSFFHLLGIPLRLTPSPSLVQCEAHFFFSWFFLHFPPIIMIRHILNQCGHMETLNFYFSLNCAKWEKHSFGCVMCVHILCRFFFTMWSDNRTHSENGSWWHKHQPISNHIQPESVRKRESLSHGFPFISFYCESFTRFIFVYFFCACVCVCV